MTDQLKGVRFGRLIPLKRSGTTKAGNVIWRCKCDCGKTVDKSANNLKRAKVPSCGCKKRESKAFQNIIGQRFGRLTVLNLDHKNSRGELMWRCSCDCGTVKVYNGSSFKYGKTKSCGCLHREIISGANNHQVKRCIAEYGVHFSSTSNWYVMAENVIKRCREENIPFGFKTKIELAAYLQEIAPERCPAFGYTLEKSRNQRSRQSFSVDRIEPEKGYVRGNLQVISWFANTMKKDANLMELEQFVTWAQKLIERTKHANLNDR